MIFESCGLKEQPTGNRPTATSTFRFTRDCRLLNTADFDLVFAQAKRSSDQFYTVLYLPRLTGISRLGFAIAKKRVSRAAARNRLKRLARESFRHNRDSLTRPPAAFDIVILANSRAALASNDELFASLDKHWQKIRKDRSSPTA